MSVKIEHTRYFAATSEKSILLKFCPDIPYYIGKCTIYFFRSNAFLTLRKCRFNTTTLNRHFVWENMRRFYRQISRRQRFLIDLNPENLVFGYSKDRVRDLQEI